MGIHQEWAKEWRRDQGDAFVVTHMKCRTIFIDAQVQLMKSFVRENETTWREFIHRTFFSQLTQYHYKFDNVIICFDNYANVPIFKSIEQSKRVSGNKSTFKFGSSDTLPTGPCEQKIWVQALQNRTFKTKVISLIASMIATEYTPPRKGTTLVVDFVNSTRIDYKSQEQIRTVLPDMKAMGESDVKFMRYVGIFGDMCIDSIDSDVLLIAAHFVTRNSYQGNIYVRRYKTRLPGSTANDSNTAEDKKRKLSEAQAPKTKQKFEYEIIHINVLVKVLHSCFPPECLQPPPLALVRGEGAVAMEVECEDADISDTEAAGPVSSETTRTSAHENKAHLNAILIFMVLLCGCDYSKKLPRIGVRSVWENMSTLVPAMMQCSSYDKDIFSVDVDLTINTMIVGLYVRVYSKHILKNTATNNMSSVLHQLQNSKLSDKTKQDLPTHATLNTMIRNIEWVINYWAIENGDPVCCVDGSNGYSLENNKLVWGGAAGTNT
jgi:hypothetical protein